MTTALMCNKGLTLRLRFHAAPNGWEKDAARFEYSLHLSACPVCREYLDELNEQARTAQMPDMPEVEK